MQAVIYEDGLECGFGPATLLRPTFDLRCGALLMREKLELRRPDWMVALVPRPALAELVEDEQPGRAVAGLREDKTLFLSGSVLVDDALLDFVEGLEHDCVLAEGQAVVGALVSGDGVKLAQGLAEGRFYPQSLDLPRERAYPLRVVRRHWELVESTPEELTRDARLMAGRGKVAGEVHESAATLSPELISIGPGSTVAPGVVIDASRGEVLVGSEVEIMSNAYIEGPAFIGDGSLVKAGARIYGGTSIGPVCKVGGEISASIIQSHSNKQHDGFLGHSFVGSWVNLGAATDTSDLRNDYRPVHVTVGGEEVDTGQLSVGSLIGDHTKTAIGTKLNTGSVIGAFCSVFPGRFPPKSLPSFSWGTAEGFVRYDVQRAIETAREVMLRRRVELSPARETAIRAAYEGR